MLKLRQIMPKGSELDTLLEKCDAFHSLHLREVNDGALIINCFACGYRHVLKDDEEKSVREEMEKQGIKL